MSKASYDAIAEVYATDMGQSMAFDDVGYYRALCQARGGRTLEFGCGTGRILLPLLASGIDIEGLDQSAGMLAVLQREAHDRGLQARVMTAGLLDFTGAGTYTTLLAPYSVVTYLTDTAGLRDFFGRCRTALKAGGLLVVDTFIPRPVQAFSDFRPDYRRAHGAGWLEREKRIAREGECNRIERRYTLRDASDKPLQSWSTCDVIRPWSEAELVSEAGNCGLALLHRDVDYGADNSADPQFVELHFSKT